MADKVVEFTEAIAKQRLDVIDEQIAEKKQARKDLAQEIEDLGPSRAQAYRSWRAFYPKTYKRRSRVDPTQEALGLETESETEGE